jgi:glycine/D-amino acid oxidase-like deaminating enzyme
LTLVPHVAILGAGILGSSTALFLVRRGVPVVLFDAAAQPVARASRWNEGKIHLGYLYAGDASLETARRILDGGLAFRTLTEDLIGESLEPATTIDADTCLVHRDSVVSAESAARYYQAVTALVAGHPHADEYLGPIVPPHRLSAAELDAEYDTREIVAGFRIPERSVSTTWVADRFAAALAADPRVELRLTTTVRGVRRDRSPSSDALWVDTDAGLDGPFDVVVNALWEGRLAIDASLGLALPPVWSHRYRLSVFLRTSRPVPIPNAVIVTGPFGDVKNYNCRDLYLSWYPLGLTAEGAGIAPPADPDFSRVDRERLVHDVVARLARVVRPVEGLESIAESVRLEGGWVYAAGQGPLDDPRSTLHRRDRVGITRAGAYFSVDTGKYSIAPWLARQLADEIAAEVVAPGVRMPLPARRARPRA